MHTLYGANNSPLGFSNRFNNTVSYTPVGSLRPACSLTKDGDGNYSIRDKNNFVVDRLKVGGTGPRKVVTSLFTGKTVLGATKCGNATYLDNGSGLPTGLSMCNGPCGLNLCKGGIPQYRWGN